MCTLVILHRPGHDWPLLLGANRDEMRGRRWRPPGRHWPDRADILAGQDRLAGGSWLGLNDHGVVAAVLNRTGWLGPDPFKRSRGELVLEALDHADALAAARALTALDPSAYRPFNLLVADNRDALWLRNPGDHAQRVEAAPVPEGVSMLTAHELNDPRSPRIAAFLPRFRAAPAPDPAGGDWFAWEALLGDRRAEPADDPTAAMAVETADGFATVCSSLLALPAPGGGRPVWRFAAGRPGAAAFAAVPGI